MDLLLLYLLGIARQLFTQGWKAVGHIGRTMYSFSPCSDNEVTADDPGHTVVHSVLS